jgi:hypothetical protein
LKIKKILFNGKQTSKIKIYYSKMGEKNKLNLKMNNKFKKEQIPLVIIKINKSN